MNFLQKNIPLKKSDQILDLCCGHGRHSFLENVNTEVGKITIRGKTHHSTITVGFYSLAEIRALFAEENLKIIKTWGSFSGKPYGLRSKRMIVLAKKL